jgi:hypothetical protein
MPNALVEFRYAAARNTRSSSDAWRCYGVVTRTRHDCDTRSDQLCAGRDSWASMTFSRLRLRLLWLTLFAFGMQVVVADFHHHAPHAAGIAARAMTAGICRPSHDRPCVPAHDDHDGCVLCWATSIAATSLTPLPLDIPSPSRVAGVRITSSPSRDVQSSRLTNVRARGPPRPALG